MARKRGVAPPEFINYKPELYTGLEFYQIAWMKLARGREPGTPTPWTTLSDFAKRYGILGEDFQRFEFYMQTLDDAYLQYIKGKANVPDEISETYSTQSGKITL